MKDRLNVLILPIARGKWERSEVGLWLTGCLLQTAGGVNATVATGVVDGEPTSCARNAAVQTLRQTRADVLIMVDNDMAPSHTFFRHAVEFLADHRGAVCIGSPYCGGPPARQVQATRLSDGERVTRYDAALHRGTHLVRCIGTGLLACRAECFEAIEPPWFDYEYADAWHTRVKTTEDFYFCRRLTEAGGRVYAAWDHWSQHAKVEMVGKPEPETVQNYPDFKSEAELRQLREEADDV